MSICKFATNSVTCVSEDESLFEAAKCMKQDKIGAVVVVKNKESDLTPIGILTDRDMVIELLADAIDPNAVCVKDVIRKPLVTIKDSESVQDAITIMKINTIRRLPLVNDQNKIVGIVTLDDLLEILIGKLSRLSEVIKKQKD